MTVAGPFPRLKVPSDFRPLQVPAQATSAPVMYICIQSIHTCEMITCNDMSSTAPSAVSLSGNCALDVGPDDVLNKALVPGRRNLLEELISMYSFLEDHAPSWCTSHAAAHTGLP